MEALVRKIRKRTERRLSLRAEPFAKLEGIVAIGNSPIKSMFNFKLSVNQVWAGGPAP